MQEILKSFLQRLAELALLLDEFFHVLRANIKNIGGGALVRVKHRALDFKVVLGKHLRLHHEGAEEIVCGKLDGPSDEVDLELDLLMLVLLAVKNPHWAPELRALDGRDAAVADYIWQDPRAQAFFDKLVITSYSIHYTKLYETEHIGPGLVGFLN